MTCEEIEIFLSFELVLSCNFSRQDQPGYRIYSFKRRGALQIFRASDAALIRRGRRSIGGGAL